MELAARREPRRAFLLVQTIFEKTLSEYIWRYSRLVWLRIQTVYQKNMSRFEVARHDLTLSGSPDNDGPRKNI